MSATEHKGHLAGINVGLLDAESIGAHVIAALRQMGSAEAAGIVTEDFRQLAIEVLERFDRATTVDEQNLIVSEFVTGALQLVVGLTIGTHGEFSKVVNEMLIAAMQGRVQQSQQQSLGSVRSAKDLDGIDMSKVKFTKE